MYIYIFGKISKRKKKHQRKEFTYLEERMLFLSKFKEGVAPGIRVVLVSSKNFNKIICSSRRSRSRGRSSRSSRNITDIITSSLA